MNKPIKVNKLKTNKMILESEAASAFGIGADKDNLEKLVFHVAKLAEDKKATDIEILDIRSIADIADYVIIVSGSSKAQLKAISEYIENELSQLKIEPAHKEGKYGDKWFLFDYVDFVVHIIDEEAREYYNLEELWSNAFFIPRDEWLISDEE